MKRSWKTSSLGIAGLLTAASSLIVSIVNGDPIDFAQLAAAVTTSIGLLFARDNDKTSEDVGAETKPLKP